MNRKFMGILLSVVLAVSLFGVLPAPRAMAATTYTWNQTETASWADSANWTPTRTTPATDDILQFNGGGTVTATNVLTQTIGQLLLSNNSTVNLQAAGVNTTLTIGGDTGTDLDVPSGSALNINGANSLFILLDTGATGSIFGNMTFSNAAHRLFANDASAITFNSGATLTQGTGCSGNIFGNIGPVNIIVFASGATLEQIAGSNPFGNSQPNSKVVFQTGSLYKHSNSNNAPSFTGRTYANFELNTSGNTVSVSGASAAVSIDNLTITAGTLNFNMTGTPGHSIKGNISVASGQTLNFNPASAGTVTLNGTSTQTISGSGTFSTQSNSTLAINNASGVTMNKDVTINGTLALTNGLLTLGTNTLTLGSSASVSGTPSASNMVVTNSTGKLCKTFGEAGLFTFPIGDNTGTAEYTKVVYTLNSGAGDVCFRVVDGEPTHKPTGVDDYISRQWHGSTTAGSLNYDAAFYYVDDDVVGSEANMSGKRYNGSLPWQLFGTVDAGNNKFSATGQTEMSEFTAFDTSLAATLASFDAVAAPSRVTVRWETASEADTLGFNLYRAVAGGEWTKLNAAMIPSQAPGSPFGASYTYDDASAARGTSYRYRLAAVGLDGIETPLETVQVSTPYWLWAPAVGR